jgi:hypothetical protein
MDVVLASVSMIFLLYSYGVVLIVFHLFLRSLNNRKIIETEARTTSITPGLTLNQIDQLLPIDSHVGVIYYRLFKFTQQHTAGLTENNWSPHLLRPALPNTNIQNLTLMASLKVKS